ncbi:hypothetical protein PM082_004745 [Marasmius tenuissimus]|nr:hypothetical protein PM082_004745 [Marasmius tenuissimus]
MIDFKLIKDWKQHCIVVRGSSCPVCYQRRRDSEKSARGRLRSQGIERRNTNFELRPDSAQINLPSSRVPRASGQFKPTSVPSSNTHPTPRLPLISRSTTMRPSINLQECDYSQILRLVSSVVSEVINHPHLASNYGETRSLVPSNHSGVPSGPKSTSATTKAKSNYTPSRPISTSLYFRLASKQTLTTVAGLHSLSH